MYILSRTSILNAIKRALETYNILHLKIDIKLHYHPNLKKISPKPITLMTQKRVYVLFQTWPCKLVHSVFNYAILASYTWIFVEGAYLHSLIFKTMTESKKFHRYLIVFGWGKLQKNETNVSPSTNYTTKDPLTD